MGQCFRLLMRLSASCADQLKHLLHGGPGSEFVLTKLTDFPQFINQDYSLKARWVPTAYQLIPVRDDRAQHLRHLQRKQNG